MGKCPRILPVNAWVSHRKEYSSDICVENLENMLSERHQTHKTTCFMILFHEMSKAGKSIEAERRLVFPGAGEQLTVWWA